MKSQALTDKDLFEQLVILLSPYAPFIAEELWEKLGNEKGTISYTAFPTFDESILVEANFAYPVSFNRKMRFKVELPLSFTPQEVEKEVMSRSEAVKYLEGKEPKKVIVVPGRIVNVVL
jgi:leucyl-tRNA synthetase